MWESSDLHKNGSEWKVNNVRGVEAVVMYICLYSEQSIMFAGSCLQQKCPTLKGWHPVTGKRGKHIQTCSLRSWDIKPSYIFVFKYDICIHPQQFEESGTSFSWSALQRKWSLRPSLFQGSWALLRQSIFFSWNQETVNCISCFPTSHISYFFYSSCWNVQNPFSAQLVFRQFPPKEHSRSLCQKHRGGVGPYTIEQGGVSCMMMKMMVLMWVYDSDDDDAYKCKRIYPLDSLGCISYSGRQKKLSACQC